MRDAMLRPKLLLLDEPSFGLAPLVVQEIFRILRTFDGDPCGSRQIVNGTRSVAMFAWSSEHIATMLPSNYNEEQFPSPFALRCRGWRHYARGCV